MLIEWAQMNNSKTNWSYDYCVHSHHKKDIFLWKWAPNGHAFFFTLFTYMWSYLWHRFQNFDASLHLNIKCCLQHPYQKKEFETKNNQLFYSLCCHAVFFITFGSRGVGSSCFFHFGKSGDRCSCLLGVLICRQFSVMGNAVGAWTIYQVALLWFVVVFVIGELLRLHMFCSCLMFCFDLLFMTFSFDWKFHAVLACILNNWCIECNYIQRKTLPDFYRSENRSHSVGTIINLWL